MPALILYNGRKGTCAGSASRHIYDPRDRYPGHFDRADTNDAKKRVSYFADSLMLRPGYKVILYELPKWQGIDASVDDEGNETKATYEIIEGAYLHGSEEGRLLCQPIKNSVITGKEKNSIGQKGVGSFIILKNQAGKATGYWKGITSTGSQEFTYTVGISNSDSSKSI